MITYEKCKNTDLETVRYEYEENGRTIKKYLHSKYDPIKEAKQWAEKMYDKQKKIYVVYGGGLLYHIYELNDTINENQKNPDYGIIIVEPIKELYEKNKDNEFFENSHILYTMAMDDVNDMISLFKKNISFYNYNSISMIEYEPYTKISTNYIDIMYEAYKAYYTYALINFNTLSQKSPLILENTVKNYYYYRRGASINAFKNIFEGKTAVIVSSGPSLDKNIQDLYGNDDVIIITGGRSMRALLKNDIRPHIVCSIEMTDDSYTKIYQKYELFGEHVPMLLECQSNYKITREYSGEKIFFDSLWDAAMADIFERNMDTLAVGGTVATLQIQIAIYMGCKNIIMIGQDLAYKEDGSYHSEQTKNDGANKGSMNEKEILYVKGNYVDKIRTDYALDSFRIIIQEIIADNPGFNFINATEGGAYIKGTEVTTLKEALSRVEKTNTDYKKIIEETIKKGKDDISDEYIVEKLVSLKKDMENIKKLSRQGLNATKLLLPYSTAKNNSILKKLDKIDEKMNRSKAANAMIHSFLHFFALDMNNIADDDYANIAKNTKRQYRDALDISSECIKFLDEEIEYRNKK